MVRYGVPGAFFLAGVVMFAVWHGAIGAMVAIMSIGVAILAIFVNAMARLMVESQYDRDREQEARETFMRTGRWPAPPGTRQGGRRP